MAVAAIIWRRLDAEGHDACRLLRLDGGWRLQGAAVFDHEGKPCSMSYDVRCDDAWRTRSAKIDGWLAAAELSLDISRSEDAKWFLNGAEQPRASGCVDVDLGFTPATNLVALRRFNLGVGDATPAPAAYLSFPELTLDLLEQDYRRVDETRYAYQAPAFGYSEVLDVAEIGFVTSYPGLWEGRLFPSG